MKTSNKNILRSIIAVALIIIAMASCKKCEYTECDNSCEMIETFNDSIINWGYNAHFIEIIDSVNRVLHVGYGFAGEGISNTEDFPKNIEGAGCMLRYDVAYKDLVGTASGNPTNGLIIFTGTFPGSVTQSAEFVLSATAALISGNTLKTISVPLELASGTTLPSNGYGQWVINGIVSPTASDISDFNTLIQNIDGVGFNIYSSQDEEEWFFDNFCITNCCTEEFMEIK